MRSLALMLALLGLTAAVAQQAPVASKALLTAPWREQLQAVLDEYPPADALLQRVLERLQNPYELQRACWKESAPRGRGLGRSRCDPDSEFPEPGGALCYRRCRPGYTSDGVTMCWKSLFDFYSRGAGVHRSCQADEVEQNALCYRPCPDGFVGVGPVCWKPCDAQTYPFYGVDYGAMCCATAEACNRQMFEMAVKFPALWARVVASGLTGNYVGAVAKARQAVDGAMAFALPICGDPIFTPQALDVDTSAAGAASSRLSMPSGGGSGGGGGEEGADQPAQLPLPSESADEAAERQVGAGTLVPAVDAAAALPAAAPSVLTADARPMVGAAPEAVATMGPAGNSTCVESAFGTPARTCAEALAAGSSCAELVVAGYDCHCTCLDQEVACWKPWTFRGVGKLPRTCDASSSYPEKGSGLLCYQPCLPGFRSDGASQCHKISLWPPGNATVYSRGSGASLSCAEGEENDAGLCYARCPPGHTGAGPICWRDCDQRSAMPINGGAICCSSAQECGERIVNLATGIPFAFADAAVSALAGGALTPQLAMTAAKDIADALNGFKMPICDVPGSPPSPPPLPAGPPANGTQNSEEDSEPLGAPDTSDGPAGAGALSVQHALQLLPAAQGSAIARLALSAEDLGAQLRAELAALLGVAPARFQLDMFQAAPAASTLGDGAGFAMPSLDAIANGDFGRALLAFSILPAPPPALAAWELSARFLARARDGLAAIGSADAASSSGRRRRLRGADALGAATSALFDAASTPLLSRTVVVESALNQDSAALELVGLPNSTASGTLLDYSPVVLSSAGNFALWAELLDGARRGLPPTAALTERSPPPASATTGAEAAETALPPPRISRMAVPVASIIAGVCVACVLIVAVGYGGHAFMRRRRVASAVK